jgi:hypothetical protein
VSWIETTASIEYQLPQFEWYTINANAGTRAIAQIAGVRYDLLQALFSGKHMNSARYKFSICAAAMAAKNLPVS